MALVSERHEKVFKEIMFKIEYFAAAEVQYKMTKSQDDELQRHLRRNDVIRALSALIMEMR